MTPTEQPTLTFPTATVTAPEWIPNDVSACLNYFIWVLEHSGQLYKQFRKIADEGLRQNPRMPLSADRILHVIRWDTDIRGEGDTFKVNDHCSALFARLYVLERPQYADKFRNRKSFLDMLNKDEEERLLLAFEPLRETKRRVV